MTESPEAPRAERHSFSASDPDIIAAAEAALDALNPTERERRIAAIFSRIDEETAQRLALLLKSGLKT